MISAAAALLLKMSPEERDGVLSRMSPENLVALPPDVMQSVLTAKEKASVATRMAPYAWRVGSLRYKLHTEQCQIVERMEEMFNRKPTGAEGSVERVKAMSSVSYFMLWRRGEGKSFTALVWCFEFCIKNPNSRLLYLAPLKKDAEKIASDIVDLFILPDCPLELQPKFDANKRIFTFPNGSLIRLEGVKNEKLDDLRGGGAHVVVLDECAQMPDLSYLLGSICTPIAERMNGKILLLTTPPREPDEAIQTKMVFDAHVSAGAAATMTLTDGTRETWDQKARLLKGMWESPEDIPEILAGRMLPRKTQARRELFCLWETDAEKMYVPEWAAKRDVLVVEFKTEFDFDRYVSMDPGHTDQTGILFAAFDPYRGVILVEDELLLSAPNPITIADTIRSKEHMRWPGIVPRLRVSDIDKFLIASLVSDHGISIDQVEKQDSLAAVNAMRDVVDLSLIEIHPRCTALRDQLDRARWNKKANDLDRDPKGGHFDLVAALKYLVRSVDRTRTRSRNPYAMDRVKKEAPSWNMRPNGRFGERFDAAVKKVWGRR